MVRLIDQCVRPYLVANHKRPVASFDRATGADVLRCSTSRRTPALLAILRATRLDAGRGSPSTSGASVQPCRTFGEAVSTSQRKKLCKLL